MLVNTEFNNKFLVFSQNKQFSLLLLILIHLSYQLLIPQGDENLIQKPNNVELSYFLPIWH